MTTTPSATAPTAAATAAAVLVRPRSRLDRGPDVERPRPRWTRRLALLGVGALLAVVAVAALAGVVVPRVAGATPYAVLTGSMSPTYPAGTLVVVRPTDPADIGVGDVVTFATGSDTHAVVTHRVVDVLVTTDGSGERDFVVKGDANATADPIVVRPGQVRGTVWYGVPWLGRVDVWVSGAARQLLVDLVAAGLVGFGARSVVRGLRERRDRREPRDA